MIADLILAVTALVAVVVAIQAILAGRPRDPFPPVPDRELKHYDADGHDDRIQRPAGPPVNGLHVPKGRR